MKKIIRKIKIRKVSSISPYRLRKPENQAQNDSKSVDDTFDDTKGSSQDTVDTVEKKESQAQKPRFRRYDDTDDTLLKIKEEKTLRGIQFNKNGPIHI